MFARSKSNLSFAHSQSTLSVTKQNLGRFSSGHSLKLPDVKNHGITPSEASTAGSVFDDSGSSPAHSVRSEPVSEPHHHAHDHFITQASNESIAIEEVNKSKTAYERFTQVTINRDDIEFDDITIDEIGTISQTGAVYALPENHPFFEKEGYRIASIKDEATGMELTFSEKDMDGNWILPHHVMTSQGQRIPREKGCLSTLYLEGVFSPGSLLTVQFICRCIGIVANDNMKPDMEKFLIKHADILKNFEITGTATTMKTVARIFGEDFQRGPKVINSGPLGGDAEIGAMISKGQLGCLFFFHDVMHMQPHIDDIKALQRLAHVHDILMANSRVTAGSAALNLKMALDESDSTLTPSLFKTCESGSVQIYKDNRKIPTAK